MSSETAPDTLVPSDKESWDALSIYLATHMTASEMSKLLPQAGPARETILHTALHSVMENGLVWHFSKDGKATVHVPRAMAPQSQEQSIQETVRNDVLGGVTIRAATDFGKPGPSLMPVQELNTCVASSLRDTHVMVGKDQGLFDCVNMDDIPSDMVVDPNTFPPQAVGSSAESEIGPCQEDELFPPLTIGHASVEILEQGVQKLGQRGDWASSRLEVDDPDQLSDKLGRDIGTKISLTIENLSQNPKICFTKAGGLDFSKVYAESKEKLSQVSEYNPKEQYNEQFILKSDQWFHGSNLPRGAVVDPSEVQIAITPSDFDLEAKVCQTAQSYVDILTGRSKQAKSSTVNI